MAHGRPSVVGLRSVVGAVLLLATGACAGNTAQTDGVDGNPGLDRAASPSALAPTPPVSRKTQSPRPLGRPAVSGGVRVATTKVTPLRIRSGAPGEIGGSGVAITLKAVNEGDQSVDLSSAVVDLRYGRDQTPALLSERPPTKRFPRKVDARDVTEATYAFLIEGKDRKNVQLLVSLDPATPLLVFDGSLASGS